VKLRSEEHILLCRYAVPKTLLRYFDAKNGGVVGCFDPNCSHSNHEIVYSWVLTPKRGQLFELAYDDLGDVAHNYFMLVLPSKKLYIRVTSGGSMNERVKFVKRSELPSSAKRGLELGTHDPFLGRMFR
jgi:hypothetical protein